MFVDQPILESALQLTMEFRDQIQLAFIPTHELLENLPNMRPQM